MRRKDREITDHKQIVEIIHRADVCRIALCMNDTPYIVAMNFGFAEGEPDCLYLHCAGQGKKIDIIKQNNRVCFQMDIDHRVIKGVKACDFSMSYKSLVGMGQITIVTDKEEKIRGLITIIKHYNQEENLQFDNHILEQTQVLRIDIDQVSAKSRR